MRWNEIDKYLVERGIRVNWFSGEAGPIGASGDLNSKDFGYWQLPNDGWRHRNVWNGNVAGYIGDLNAYDALIQQTRAWQENRFLGYVLFTCPPGKDWKKFKLTEGDWYDFSQHARSKPPLAISSPTEPEPATRIVDIVDELPKHESKTYSERALSEIATHVVHHVGASTDSDCTPEAAARWHVDHNDWPGIGYHFFVTKNGTIYQTNRLTTISYHVGQHNRFCVGTCLAGNFSIGQPTTAQLDSLRWLHNEFLPLVLDMAIPLKGHKELPGMQTSCPGDWDWHALEDGQEPTPEPEPESQTKRIIIEFPADTEYQISQS